MIAKDKSGSEKKIDKTEEVKESVSEQDTKTDKKSAGSEGKKKKKRAWLIAVGLIILVIMAFIPYYYTANPASCDQCHSMEVYYTSWKKSVHGINETACSQCHVRPGWFANVTYRIGFYRELFAELFKMDLAPWGATAPGEASCTRELCHSLNRLSSRSGELKVDHEKHYKKAKIPCRECHAGVTHPNVKSVGSILPLKQQCFSCHADRVDKCDLCHTTKYKRGMKPKTPHVVPKTTKSTK